MLTAKGKEQVEEVAGALEQFIGETKDLPDNRLVPTQIWHATSAESTQTAVLLHQRLTQSRAVVLVQKEALSPEHTSPYGPIGNHAPVVDDIIAYLGDARWETALVVVGHQPLLGWIGAAFSGEAYPIDRAELLCLRFANGIHDRRWWRQHRCAVDKPAVLRWVLTPRYVSGDGVLSELKEKIRGKMEGAKLLGTFSTAILGFMLNTLIDSTKLHAVGAYQPVLFGAALAFFLAILLYFASYYAYDVLLMPSRFWAEPPPIRRDRQPDWLVMRPPSSASWVLYQNMMHVWRFLFTPAMVLVCAGLALLGLAVFQPKDQYLIFAIVLMGLLAVSFKPLYRVLGPRLGSQD